MKSFLPPPLRPGISGEAWGDHMDRRWSGEAVLSTMVAPLSLRGSFLALWITRVIDDRGRQTKRDESAWRGDLQRWTNKRGMAHFTELSSPNPSTSTVRVNMPVLVGNALSYPSLHCSMSCLMAVRGIQYGQSTSLHSEIGCHGKCLIRDRNLKWLLVFHVEVT